MSGGGDVIYIEWWPPVCVCVCVLHVSVCAVCVYPHTGGHHSIARTLGGAVFSWGWGDNGQLGRGDVSILVAEDQGIYIYICLYKVR
jgi:hypothetical protein